ncbi:MAG TPA: ribonuclease III [Steroidobacteraceae bacterium]|nr:ribonuclease III [Steroidobacteraceae bacterium]
MSDWVERSFGYVFSQPDLCCAALTHRSAGANHNERLEFLGDSVLNCAVAQMLFEANALADEGALSRQRASLVSGETLAQIASELGVGEHLLLGAGELRSGGFRRASILADALEAMLGAIFLDAGFDTAAGVVRRILGPRMSDLPAVSALKDPKTRLQEALQARGMALPVYTLIAVEGEAHAQTFTVNCEVAQLALAATADGGSRRRAEQLAAERLLALMPVDLRRQS